MPSDQIDPAEIPTVPLDNLYPVERYHRTLEEARGKVRGLRVGGKKWGRIARKEKERLILQKWAQCFLTSGEDLDWYALCDQCGIQRVDEVLAKHRAEFGTVTLVDFFRFTMETMNWSVGELEEHMERAYLHSIREEGE